MLIDLELLSRCAVRPIAGCFFPRAVSARKWEFLVAVPLRLARDVAVSR
jgi:hypothetical protein